MKKIIVVLMISIMSLFLFSRAPVLAEEYNYGDYKSQTLIARAWEAFKKDEIEAVFAYTNKCVEMYAQDAQKMQKRLKEYPKGDKDEIISKWWALNDVATAYFIQGETYAKSGMKEMARGAYEEVIKNFSFGQCWDPQGWFWKPADAAKEKIAGLK